jgi:dimethylhistidine N-methyltransferase
MTSIDPTPCHCHTPEIGSDYKYDLADVHEMLSTLTLDEVLAGLLGTPRQLPPKAFYDERGARLFEEITQLDEYYPTRTEREILTTRAREIAEVVGRDQLVIEYGSGDAAKSRVLLPYIRPRAYVPVDISVEQLMDVANALDTEYPAMAVYPVVADFTETVHLPAIVESIAVPRLALFLGSTIGNFHPDDAVVLMKRFRETVGPGGAVLLGADLRKDPTILHAAYNDKRGITAAFNLNVLDRLQREFSARIDTGAFVHYALYEPLLGRIEMHLVARRETTIEIGGERILFNAGEGIWTESSYKFTRTDLARLGAAAAMPLAKVWTDQRGWFALALYRVV